MGFIIKQNLNQANVNETPINQLELVTDTGRLTYDQCVKYLFQLSRSFIIDNQGKTENVFKEPEQTGFWLEKIDSHTILINYKKFVPCLLYNEYITQNVFSLHLVTDTEDALTNDGYDLVLKEIQNNHLFLSQKDKNN